MKDKKTDWIKGIAKSITENNSVKNKEEISYWKRYNYDFEERFAYLTKIGKFSLPTQDRHIPLQRKYINLLVSKKTIRPFKYSVFIDSDEVRKQKYDLKVREFVSFAIGNTKIASFNLEKQIREIDSKIQKVYRAIQQQQIAPEDTAQAEEMISQLQFYKELLNEENILGKQILDQYRAEQHMSPTEVLEKLTTRYLRTLEKKMNFVSITTNQFKHKLVTGKYAFLVAQFNENSEPIIKSIDASRVVYDTSGSEDSINKKDWVMYNEKMSFGQVKEGFGMQIIEEYGVDAMQSLEETYSTGDNSHDMYALPSGGVIFGNEIMNNNYGDTNSISVKWVWFRASTPVYRRVSVGKNNYIHKHILPSKDIINTDEYHYRKGIYVHKKNKDKKYKKSEINTYSKKSGDKLEKRDLFKVYHAVIINDEYIVNASEWKNIVRGSDNYNRINLPIFGPAFDSVINRPYSLIKETNDIQDLIDVVNISREYMIAAAGTKTNVIDVSQKPDYMKEDEWELNIKLGRIYIQTVDSNGVPKHISFNQWQSFDNSISSGVQYYTQIIDSLSYLMGNIIGISYQSLGQTVRTDQVGTTQEAIQQSEVVTEILFYESAQTEKEVLEEYLNLKIRNANGSDLVFTEENLNSNNQEILKTSKIGLNRLAINLYSYGEDYRKIQELKQLAMQMKQELQLSLGSIIRIFNADTLKEMEAKIDYFENQARKAASEQARAAQEQEMQTFKETEKYKNDLEVYLEQVKQKFESAKYQLDQIKLNQEQQRDLFDQKAKMIELSLQKEANKIDLYKIKEDTIVEKDMLLLDDKHKTIDEQIRLLELQLEEKLGNMKIRVDAKKAQPGAVNNHINDN